MEREEYPTLHQIRALVVTCKPGFDDWCRAIESQIQDTYEYNAALKWCIRTKPDMLEIPSETDMYPDWGPWNEELLKLYRASKD